MADRSWDSVLTLLCERCGYVIEDLDPDGPCPECGKPISESMPTRPGTPWQQHPSLRNLVKTWWMTLRHPKRTLDTMSLHDDRGMDLTSASIFVGVGLAVVLSSLPMIIYPEVYFTVLIIGGIIGTSLAWLVFFTLTAIEAMGLRIIARKRGFRIDEHVSWAIVGHGCVGWVMMAASFTLGVWSGMFFLYWTETIGGSGRDFTGTLLRVLFTVFFLGGVPLGFLFFEWFAWMGLRRCKYANHPAARPGMQLAEPPPKQPETT